jgi:dTDP-4-dehydrorhamnose 3,5-epimerase
MIAVEPLTVDGHELAIQLTPSQFADERGFFSEVYNKAALARLGIDLDFVQDNHSLSRSVGTVRGLHFQSPPFAQSKLIRVVRGAIFDVALDIRRGSPTYGRHVSAVLSARDGNQLLVPAGLAHGFCTLEPDTEVVYKVDAPYARDHDCGVLWCDPDLGIEWPVTREAAVISPKDRELPRLKELTAFFHYRDSARSDGGSSVQEYAS